MIFRYLRYVLFLLLTILLCLENLFSQNKAYHIVKNYTTSDGLSDNFIRSIAEDSNGMVYVTCFNSFTVFDGYNFTNYTHDPLSQLNESLPDIELKKVCIDKFQNKWILANKTLCQFDPENEHFIPCYTKSKEFTITSDSFSNINTFHNYCIALGNNGFEVYIGNNTFFNIKILDSTSQVVKGNFYDSFYIDNEDGIWLFDDYHLFQCAVYKKPGGNFSIKIIKRFPFAFYEIKSNRFQANLYELIVSKNKNKIWVTSNIGLYCLDNKTNRIRRIFNELPFDEFNNKDQKLIWSSDEEGLICYSYKKNLCDTLLSREKCIPVSYCIGNHDILWIGGNLLHKSEGSGIYKLIKITNPFRHYLNNNKKFPKPSVFAIFKDKNNTIWIGEKDSKSIIRILEDGSILPPKNFENANNSKLVYPSSFACDNENENLWIGFYEKLLLKYNFNSGIFINYLSDPLTARQFSFMKGFKLLQFDRHGNIFTGGVKGFFCFDISQNRFLFCDSSTVSDVYSLYIDKNDNYWIGKVYNEKHELICIDGRTYKTIYKNVQFKKNIQAIIESDSNVWVCTYGDGVYRINLETGAVKQFTTKNGLANNRTCCILKDNKSNMWISTENGISKIDSKSLIITNYSEKQGLFIKEFNTNAVFQSVNGELFFGGQGGFVSILFPDSIADEQFNYKVPILLTEIKFSISGIESSAKNIIATNQIKLPEGTNNFIITFTCPDHRNIDSIHYRLKLDGHDKDWIYRDKQNRYASYMDMDPGTYKFIIQATNPFGKYVWEKSIDIIIPYKPQQHPLFKLFFYYIFPAFVIFAIIFIFWQKNKQKIKKREYELEIEKQVLEKNYKKSIIVESTCKLPFISDHSKLEF